MFVKKTRSQGSGSSPENEKNVKARTAQERLVELEKGNAPLLDQIYQAALFAGTSISGLQGSLVAQDTISDATISADNAYHARHEYVLRWLLKKLQDNEARRCPAAWRLLRILLGNVPARNAARILSDRKFIITLRQALEEVVGRKDTRTLHASVTAGPCDESSETVTSSPVKDKRNKNISRKRKRDSKTMDHERSLARELGEKDAEVQMAIYEATNCMIHMSKHSDSTSDTFTSEYMKSSLRTSDEEAARILGGWLILCRSPEYPSNMDCQQSLLDPFLEIWEARLIGTEPFEAYRRHCLCPSLAILSAKSQPAKWKPQLEQLLVRNVIAPAKAAYKSSNKKDLLRNLVSDIVSRQPLFSPIIFNTAIRCIQPHFNRPRPQQDTVWLQEVFTVLIDAMAGDSDTSTPEEDLEQKVKNSGSSADIIRQLLQACINNRIILELPLLHLITSRYGLKPRYTDWSILSTIIMLDANVFLIPPHSVAPLNDLLSRITVASVNASWPTIADRVIDNVLVPLMSEFAKARQLTAFIHLWFEQVVALEGFRQSQEHNFLNAWEDDALLLKLKDLLETSLTTIQIVEIIDWLHNMMTKSRGSFYVLLDAVVGAICREETIDTVKPMIYKIINVYTQFEETEYRYQSSRWRIAAHYFRWSLAGHFVHISERSGVLSSLLPLDNSVWQALSDVERVEALRCLCAAWISERVMSAEDATTSALIELFQQVTLTVESAITVFESPQALGEDKWGERIVSKHRGSGWLICAYAHCILVEYPEILELVTSEIFANGQRLLKDLIWLASATSSSGSTNSLVLGRLADMWMDLFQNDCFQNNPKILRPTLSATLDCASHITNPFDKHNPGEKSQAANGFAIKCLHRLPVEVFSNRDREIILRAWPPNCPVVNEPAGSSYPWWMNALNPCVLSLKMRMMKRPTLCDGVTFRGLVDLGEQIVSHNRDIGVLLPLFEELAKRTFSHVLAIIDQPKGQEYIRGIISGIESWLQSSGKVKTVPSYAMISLAKVAFSGLNSKEIALETLDIVEKKKLRELQNSFRKLLLRNIERRLEKLEKLANNDGKRTMSLCSCLNALDSVEVEQDDLVNLQSLAKPAIVSLRELDETLARRLELFMLKHEENPFREISIETIRGDITSFGDIASVDGRQAILQKVLAISKSMTEPQKLGLATKLLQCGKSDIPKPGNLLAFRHLITSCDDSRPVTKEDTNEPAMSISLVYSNLAETIQKAKDVREFCIISETMELILGSKSRAVSQYNIETTLATINILCGRRAPSLPASHAGTIYIHLVSLFRTILNSHRQKLQGRFHLIVQTLQSLLRCLFIPGLSSPYTEYSSLVLRPPWLGSTTHQLNSTHASAFTRLVTLICDPTTSSVSSSQDGSRLSLTSAPKEARRYAGQHMPYILGLYIKLQLDMAVQMKAEVRRELTPGVYAILDCAGKKGRRLLGEGMDEPGRALLSEHIRDWSRFGEWKG